MKKNKFIVLLVITLLVILSSSVMAVEREEFEKAINEFVNSMSDYNNRFVCIDDKYTDSVYLGYINQTTYTGEDTVLCFSDDSFIAYVYHEVLGLDMSKDKKVYEQIDIYKDILDRSDAEFNYFDKVSDGDYYISENWKNDGVLQPGDILIETNGFGLFGSQLTTWFGTCGMYLGDGKIAMFESEGINIYDITKQAFQKKFGGKGFDVARVKEEVLKNTSKLTYKFDATKVNVNAMTIEDAIGNLDLVVTLEDEGLVFRNSSGEAVSLSDIYSTIKLGYTSGNKNGSTYFRLEYKDAGGNMVPLYVVNYDSSSGIFIGGYDFISLNRLSNESSNCLKFDYSNDISKLSLGEYRANTHLYWGGDYIAQSDHSLYLGMYQADGVEEKYIKCGESILIGNGKEINGTIECFSALVDVDSNLGRKPTLQDFLNTELQVPDNVYELDFSTSNTQRIEREADGKYKKNSRNEILFKVNKSGTYVVKIIPNSTGKAVETVIMHTINYDDNKKEYFGFDNGESYPYSTEYRSYLRNAGKETFDYCEDNDCAGNKYKNGEYISGYEEMAFPFINTKIYALSPEKTIENAKTDDCTFEILYISDGLTEIFDHDKDESLYASQSSSGVTEVHISGEKSQTLFERLEYLLSFCVRNIANGLVITMDTALGWVDENDMSNTISIDKIIFDEYPLTKLNLFTKNLKEGEQQNSFIKTFATNINKWFYNFTLIAVVAYLIILLYMGIRIVISSTAAKKSMYKELFVQWVTGVIILFLFPIVIKYAIKINSEFVAMIGETVKNMDESQNTTDYKDPDKTSDLSTDEKVSEESKQMELNPFDQNDKGYMAVMSRRAHTTKRLSYAMVYLIMAFQLVIIAVMYYKRLFMVAFLIVIFPIVMIAHVLEKVANVKTGGAFSKWTREILITIFVQSIHAVVYSFASATVIAAGDSNNDWILMLVGVSFLFNGESILKKILGYDSQTTPSLAQTAMKTAAAITLTKKAVTSVADNVVGSGSHLGMAIKYGRESQKMKLKAKNMDVLGVPPKDYKIPNANELEHYNSMYDSDPEAREVGNAIQVLNHVDLVRDPAQLKNALDTIGRAKASGKYTDLMKDLKINDKTFKALQNARDVATADAVSGQKTKQQIDMELTMELERILPNQDIKPLKVALYSQMGSLMSGTLIGRRNTSEDGVKQEIKDAEDKYANLKSRINIADKSSFGKDDNKDLEKKAAQILRHVYGKDAKLTKEQYQMALSVCMLKDSASGKYDANELMTSANFAFKNQINDANFAKMASYVGVEDLGEFRYVIAESVCEKGYGKPTTDGRAWRIAGNKKIEPSDKKLKKTCETARNIIDSTENRLSEREEEVENSGNLVAKKENQRRQEEIEELSDVVSIVDLKVMEQERARLGVTKKDQVNEIISKRKSKNTNEQTILMDFSKEMIDKNNDIYESRVDGMTKAQLEEMAKIAAHKKAKEIGRTIQTTAATVVGAPIGAGITIGLSDDDDTLKEGLAGALAGAAALDSVVEAAYDETKHTRKVKVRNPYTGEIEEVKVTTSGAFSDAEVATLLSSEASSSMSSKLKEQFLQNKINRDINLENKKILKQQKEEQKKRLEDAYNKAIKETAKQRNNNQNNENNS